METHAIEVFINKKLFKLANAVQTGRALKELADVPLADTLFLDRPHEDEVITNDMQVTLKNGDHLHTAPPADYGGGAPAAVTAAELGSAVEVLVQPDGWTFVVMHNFKLPPCYRPDTVKLLLKLPPQFPDASPDMHWISPPAQVNGAAPKGTSMTNLLGEVWQQFSWHLKPGAWRPGVSELRDFLRAVRARFERRD